MTTRRTLVDGVACEQLPAADRGLMYGDGLFETIAIREGRPCLWAAHVGRLRRGAARLAIPCPPEPLLFQECRAAAGSESRCVVRLTLTRGSGGRGYRPPPEAHPRRVISCYPWPDYPAGWLQDGIRVELCHTRLAEQPLLAGVKHLNRLEQVLARAEWADPGQAEGLMCSLRGNVVGGTMSNLFILVESGLLTPRLDRCGIAGTVRGLVLENAARFGLRADEADLRVADVLRARGMFVTNALIGAWAVRRLGERRFDLRSLPLDFLRWVRSAAHRPDAGGGDACAPC